MQKLHPRSFARNFALVIGVLLAWAFALPGQAETPQNNTKNFTATSQDRSDIAAIEGYLTRLTSFTARFTQRNQDGGSQTGVFYCQRKPGVSGKMRIDYDKPSPISLITYQGMLLYLDRDRDESSYIPLDSSLIGLFAEPVIHFGEKVIVTGLVRHGDLLNLGLRSAENPDFGEAILYFRRAATAPNAVSLVAWRIVDGSGTRTDVVLNSMVEGLPNQSDLFTYVPPQMRGHGKRF